VARYGVWFRASAFTRFITYFVTHFGICGWREEFGGSWCGPLGCGGHEGRCVECLRLCGMIDNPRGGSSCFNWRSSRFSCRR
jgi:hypothetical protein